MGFFDWIPKFLQPPKRTPAASQKADKKRETNTREVYKSAAPAPPKPKVSKPAPTSWAEKPIKPSRVIPAGVGPTGEKLVRSGWADPDAWSKYQSGEKGFEEPTSVVKRLWKGTTPGMAGEAFSRLSQGVKPGDPSLFEETVVSPIATAGEVVSDLNTRISKLRSGYANNLNDSDDLPEFEYELPSGNKFTSDQKLKWFWVGDELLNEHQVKGITPYQEKGFEILLSGQEDYADGKTTDGRPYRYTYLQTPAGKVVHRDDYKYAGDAFEDGTIARYADGSVPQHIEKARTRQTNDKWPLNMGVQSPRAPWQDDAGNTVGFDKDYDVRHSTADEALPWLADMVLGSAPYFVPYYNLASGAARAMPYAEGIKGSTYDPNGEKFREGLTSMGKGTYAEREMTNSQALGGGLAPIFDAAAERIPWGGRGSGQAIGGIEKLKPLRKLIGERGVRFLEETAAGKVLAAAITEGLEEQPAQLADQLEQDSWANYGKDSTYNRMTGEAEYDPNAPKFQNTLKNQTEAFLAGGTMGAMLRGGQAGLQGYGDFRTAQPKYRPADVRKPPFKKEEDR